ncbi:aspartyl/asparaginyl beta-hydroxylase isoform X2 [Galleria mellonella]|uniref:Aspartyl/asparaginyl beta-hydroxylase isoform X2 n=1 Tax=Galleria mellonella TaxID=7137 RepID=A0A6J1WU08_GALME|nr:aspartyl/asparaginyl beta-hydroxylase isoform X2 [Galleria mellonella]
MSGDVQPRKRKDKKRKKDDLGVEEPRGTAAVFGEGDVFIHSQHDHGTGGHWCAKIIFFSLLAVLITLIGLIILENRGLTELEANSVESRYSGVLEGWLEDAPDDDHHDEHTLELNHPDDENDHGDDHELDHNDDDDHDEDENHDDDHNDENNYEETDNEHTEEDEDDDHDEQQDDEDDEDHNIEESDEDEQEQTIYSKYFEGNNVYNDDDKDGEENNEENDDLQTVDEDDSQETNLNQYDDDNDSSENNNDIDNDQSIEENEDEQQENYNSQNDEDEEHEEEDNDEDTEVELEKIERELPNEEPISTELPALPEEDIDDDKSQEISEEFEASKEDNDEPDTEEEFLEADDDEPPVERITAPAGKPYVEVEEEVSSEQPPDTLNEEEEYEKQQEELRREKEKSSHLWLKLSVGGALLVATHAVIRRATAPRDEPASEERSVREETPLLDRRMTLIPEDFRTPAQKTIIAESSRPIVEEAKAQKITPQLKAPTPPPQEEVEEEEEEKQSGDEDIEPIKTSEEQKDKELYSDDEEAEEEEEEEVVIEKKESAKEISKVEKKSIPQPETEQEDDPDDVEIIDDEQLEEELEEEEDDISDVDDVELLTRLEAKYGRLPEPERPGQKHKDGGNSIEDQWPGEPSDPFWRQELDSVEEQLQQGSWAAVAERAEAAAATLRDSARAQWLVARLLDLQAEARRDNRLLSRAITAYLHLLKMNERLSDKKLLEVTNRALDRIKFRGSYLSAEPVYKILIRRFPDKLEYRNNLTISFLMANRADLAEGVLKETLQLWPDDRVALAHYGFILKTQHNRLEEALAAFQKALEGDAGAANEPRFYYHYGDTFLLLGRHAEAHEVHKKGAALGHFLSPAQRSLYNVPRLKSKPWWNIDETPYAKLARALEKSWRDILKEGEAAKAIYEKEKEGLKERGEWSQLDLFVRGQEIPNRCKRAPVTCSIVRAEAAAVGCRRGQIKFSAIEPGTHVRPHVGPTNCRLRMHLGLSNTKDTFIRVDQTTRQWQVGKVFMFDDSFEHEVWHNGTGTRLVLIVDVWHPDLTPSERRTLPAI